MLPARRTTLMVTTMITGTSMGLRSMILHDDGHDAPCAADAHDHDHDDDHVMNTMTMTTAMTITDIRIVTTAMPMR
jgi:hypothetical protein